MIRLGVIGCGNMGGVHSRGFANIGKRLQIAAAVDLEGEKADEYATHFDGCRAATDYRAVLDEVDAVLLSLPHHLHHKIGMDCIAAGKHVLMEKPLANTEVECLDLIRAADDAGIILMVAYCMRYHPLIQRLEEIIREKTYGDVFQVSIWTEQMTRREDTAWLGKANTLGGGQLFSHGCHYVDLLLWFLGTPIEGSHVGTNFGTPWMEKEGTSNVSMRFESGALGYHFGTWGARGTRLGYSFHAHCTEGMVDLAFSEGKLLLHKGRCLDYDDISDGVTVLAEADTGKHTEMEMRHFLDCVENKTRPLTDGPSSLQSLRVIWKLYEAEEQGTLADLRGLGLEAATMAAVEPG